MLRYLYVVRGNGDDDSSGISVVQHPMGDDVVLCKLQLSERAAQAYDAFENLRRIFGDGADSPLYPLLDQVATAGYRSANGRRKLRTIK